MSKKDELLWLADEFQKHAPGPFLKAWVWFPSTDVSGLADVINTWPGPLKIFGLPIPARLLGFQADGDPWVRANCCLAWEGRLLEELFSRASRAISSGQENGVDLWAGVFLRAAFESDSALVSFSKGPSVWAGQTEYDLRTALDLRTQKNPDFPPLRLKEKLEALSVPWVLYAEHKSPFLASAVLCRQLAQEEIQAPADMPIPGWLAIPEIIERAGIPKRKAEAFEKALFRARDKKDLPDSAWQEMRDVQTRKPRYLFDLSCPAVQEIIKKYRQDS